MDGTKRCHIHFGLEAGESARAIAKEYQHKVETGCYVGRTYADYQKFLYGEGTAAKLHIAKIDPKKVVLKPRLVGIEMKQGPSDSPDSRPSRIYYAPSETCAMGKGSYCLEDPQESIRDSTVGWQVHVSDRERIERRDGECRE